MKSRYDSGRFVLASVDRLDEAWRAADGSRHVGPGASGVEYVNARRDVAAGTWTPPIVAVAEKGVTFTTGRYHFAAARDLGRRSVVVEVGPDQAAAFREKFGA